MLKFKFLVILLLSTCSFAEDDYTDGLHAGELPLPQDFNQVLQDNLGQHLGQIDTFENADFTRFRGQTANNLISTSAQYGTGTSLRLQTESNEILNEGQAIDFKSQERFVTTDTDKLSSQDLIQHSIISQETFNNHENPATQYLLDLERGKTSPDLVLPNYLNQTIKQEYSETLTPLVSETVTYKYCSETLINKQQSEILELIIQVTPQQPPDVEQTVTAAVGDKACRNSTIAINLRTGVISGASYGGSNVTNPIGNQQIIGNLTLSSSALWPGLFTEKVGHNLSVVPTEANDYLAQINITQYDADTSSWRRKRRDECRRRRDQTRGIIYSWKYNIRPPIVYNLTEENWHTKNPELQALKDTGECPLLKEECLEGPETKIINGLAVTRPCWKKKLYYDCAMPQGEDNCTNIPSNCLEEETKYIEFFGAQAVKIRKFRCIEPQTNYTREQIVMPKGIQDVSDYQKNNDLGDALTALNFAKEIKEEFAKENKGEQGLFFKGDSYLCNFTKGCCVGKNSGWSRVFHCNQDERQLAQRVPRKACYKVGSFREQKSLLQKIKKVDKIAYCCFGSSISRIVQQGAHSQLNKSWGHPSDADCRALSLAELEQLDFSLPDFDFSDLINDLKAKAQRSSMGQDKIMKIQEQLQAGLGQSLERNIHQTGETALVKQQQANIAKQNLELQEKIQAKRLETLKK